MLIDLEKWLGRQPQEEPADPLENFPPAPKLVRVLNDSKRVVSVELFNQTPKDGNPDREPVKTLQIRVAIKAKRPSEFGEKRESEYFEDHYANLDSLKQARGWLTAYDLINPTQTWMKLRDRERINASAVGIILSSLEHHLSAEVPITIFDPRLT